MSLLNQWKNRPKDISTKVPLVKAPDMDFYPLSRGQQRLFFLDQLYPQNPVYNSSEIYTFKGHLDVENLKESLLIVFNTNDILKCSFHFIDGKPVQKVNHQIELNISDFDLSSLPEEHKKRRQEQLMRDDSLTTFDLASAPLMRASIIKLDDENHLLFVTIHHIITDKWSISLFQDQLLNYYKKKPSVEEFEHLKSELQFTDYAFWEQENPVDKAQLTYWKEKLSGEIPQLELPTDFVQTAQHSFKGGSNVYELSRSLSAKILNLCKDLDVTPYVLLLAVYNMMLARYSKQQDILIGSPISLRGTKALENIFGFFDETIVLRNTVLPDTPFQEFVKTVRITVLEALSNKEVPFDLLVKELQPERSLSGNPFFRTMFIYHDVDKFVFDPEIDISYSFYNSGISKFDLTLYISNDAGVLSVEFEYAKDLFDEISINRFQRHFQLLLEGITNDSSQTIGQIPMLTKEEGLLLKPKSYTLDTPYSKYSAIHDIIIDQAKCNPNAIALVFEDQSITYKELDGQSDKVARRILEYSKGENQIVGLCLERSIKMIVGLLGILKSGCAYLPLDLNYPSKRIDFVLEDSNVEIILTQKSFTSKFQSFNGKKLHIDSQEFTNSESNNKIALPAVDANKIAYVIYTSGSTGKPKGVPITHANIISSNEARLVFYPENPSAFLLLSSISFDSSKAGVFWTLCTGGTLVISRTRLEQNIEELSQVISDHKVSHTLMLPSLFKMVLDYSKVKYLESLKAVVVAGEECTPTLCKEHFNKLPKTELYNEYGPTEATVWCIAHKVEKDNNEAVVPVGKPTSNAEIYLLDTSLQPVPFGAIGEIFVGGKGLSKTYLNRPELTKKAFVSHPFRENLEEVLYKTGDLGRYRNDGAIEFLGRSDHQVKIRGFRIELNEIENALLNNDSIKEAIVMAEHTGSVSNTKAAKQLVAYVVTEGPLDLKLVKNFLRSELPSYMIPNNIIDLEKFPLLPNGKVDKNSLQELGQLPRDKTQNAEPSNEIESKLLAIWQDVLNHSDIGVTDNYFEIGGDSMTSIKMFWQIEKVLKVKLSPSVLFMNPTIEEIAKKIKADKLKQIESFKHIVTYREAGSKTPLFCMHGGEGHILFYQNLANYLNENRPVYFVQPKGANGDDEILGSIEQMAEDYLSEILQVYDGEVFNLVFYCCGALVIEMSNRLKALGKTANIIIVDSSPKYVVEENESKSKLRFAFFFQRLLKSPFSTLKQSLIYRYRRKVVPIYVSLIKDKFEKRQIKLRNQLEEVQSNYEWKEFDANCTLILGKDGLSDFDTKDIESWNHWCNSEIEVLYNSGNHFNIFDLPHAKTLGETVESVCL